MVKKVKDESKQYTRDELRKSDLDPDPFKQFEEWFNEASGSDLPYPNAMTVATSSKDGTPSARMMLLKGFGKEGFAFYTNRYSRKGKELEENPKAALVFWWAPLERQVRVEGNIKRVPVEEVDSYFETRPRGSRLGAWASDQSRIIEGRAVLDSKLEELKQKYESEEIPRPEYWVGYSLRATSIEFWQGRTNRLHDRLRYRLDENGEWIIERLAP